MRSLGLRSNRFVFASVLALAGAACSGGGTGTSTGGSSGSTAGFSGGGSGGASTSAGGAAGGGSGAGSAGTTGRWRSDRQRRNDRQRRHDRQRRNGRRRGNGRRCGNDGQGRRRPERAWWAATAVRLAAARPAAVAPAARPVVAAAAELPAAVPVPAGHRRQVVRCSRTTSSGRIPRATTSISRRAAECSRSGGTYYWYGVNYEGAATYAANPSNSNSDTNFVAITTYSSTDLAHWTFDGNALTYASVAAKLTMTTSTWIGRVGAAYNATTKKYVIVGQYQGTPDTEQFFATSDTPNGAFVVDHAQATITNVANSNCGDQSIFNDDDGTAYIVCSSESGTRQHVYRRPRCAQPISLEAEPATPHLQRGRPRGEHHVQIQRGATTHVRRTCTDGTPPIRISSRRPTS